MSFILNRSIRSTTSALVAAALLAGTSAMPAQARTLHYASSSPPTDIALNKVLRWWADEIETRTDGSLEVEFHWMGSLLKLSDAAEGVSAGIADIAYISPAYSLSDMPLWYMGNTSHGPGDQYIPVEAFSRVIEEFPPLEEEAKRNNMKYIAHVSNGAQVLISTTRPYKTPADFQGDKVRLPSSYAQVADMAGWDVGAVSLHFADIYSAMERGTIDGAATYVPLIEPYSHNEVGDYVVEPDVGQNTNVIMMNRDTWNALSEDEQQVIESLREEMVLRLAEEGMKDEKHFREALASDPDDPLEFFQLSGEQRQIWEDDMALYAEERIEKVSQFNPAAAELEALYREKIKEVAREVEEKGFPWERQ